MDLERLARDVQSQAEVDLERETVRDELSRLEPFDIDEDELVSQLALAFERRASPIKDITTHAVRSE